MQLIPIESIFQKVNLSTALAQIKLNRITSESNKICFGLPYSLNKTHTGTKVTTDHRSASPLLDFNKTTFSTMLPQ